MLVDYNVLDNVHEGMHEEAKLYHAVNLLLMKCRHGASVFCELHPVVFCFGVCLDSQQCECVYEEGMGAGRPSPVPLSKRPLCRCPVFSSGQVLL